MARIENLVQNGRAKYTSSTVEVRRNRASDPRQVTAAGKSNLTLVTGQFGPFSTASRGQVNGPWKDFSPIDIVSASSTETQMVARFWLATSTRLFIQNLTDNKTVTASWDGKLYCLDTGELASGGYPITDGVLREYACTFTVPATQTTPWRFGFKNAFGDSVDRGEITMTGFCIESGTQEIRPYFDGSYSPDPDLTPSWTGMANESSSVLSGTLVTGFTTGNTDRAFRIVSSQWPDGGQSIRVMPRGGGETNTYVESNGFGTTAGKIYGVAGIVHLDQSLTGSLHPSALKFWVTSNGDPAVTYTSMPANAPGDYLVMGTFVSKGTYHYIRFMNGSSIPGEDVFWTDMRVSSGYDTKAEALAAVQTYFDGDSEPFRYGPIAQIVTPKWSGTPGQSSSYFDYEEPWTPNTTWDDMPDRVYELGTDRGMFYPPDADGVPWSGLISVKEKVDENSPTMYYIDGVRYYADIPSGEFQASLEAFTYPDEFINYSGYFEETDGVPGLYYDEQAAKTFGLSYRTKVGDGQYGPDIFYKIHLVYNVIAVVTDRDYTTINGSPEASTFTWDLYTIPAESSVAPINTAHLIIDSRKIPGSKLKALEDLLYGDGVNPPELPSSDDVRSILL